MTSNDRNTQSSQGSRDSQSARNDRVGNDQSARSEEQLDREERSLIGNTPEDRNLTGSTTYVTLPEQKGDNADDQSSRQASASHNSHGASRDT